MIWLMVFRFDLRRQLLESVSSSHFFFTMVSLEPEMNPAEAEIKQLWRRAIIDDARLQEQP